jgi:serine/threonine protein kinase
MSVDKVTGILLSKNMHLFTALKKSNRFYIIKDIQDSLFGRVKLGWDSLSSNQVCIKISYKEYCTKGQSLSGPIVMENVQSETEILHFLTKQANVSSGSDYIAQFIAELEDDLFHYLITEYCEDDMFKVLDKVKVMSNENEVINPGKLSEAQAKIYFAQLVQAVAFLHARHIVHLDLSIENICVAENGSKIKLIDFGLATMHPNSTNQLHLKQNIQSKLSRIDCDSKLDCKDSFFCKPIIDEPDQKIAKPGKMGYMSPELYSSSTWDGYANDCYALGNILYLLLTGRPAYTRPRFDDLWFICILSGQWKWKAVREQPVAKLVYSHLSDDAINLIDKILKPQETRINIQQILEHEWLKA